MKHFLTPFLDKDGLIRLSGRTEAAPLAYKEKNILSGKRPDYGNIVEIFT
jgi:hypothetical protein